MGWLFATFVLAIADITVIALVMPICFIERRGPIASVAQSLRLTRGNGIRPFGASFIALLPISFASGILKAFGNAQVAETAQLLSTALSFAALSIHRVVALDLRDKPDATREGETDGSDGSGDQIASSFSKCSASR